MPALPVPYKEMLVSDENDPIWEGRVPTKKLPPLLMSTMAVPEHVIPAHEEPHGSPVVQEASKAELLGYLLAEEERFARQ